MIIFATETTEYFSEYNGTLFTYEIFYDNLKSEWVAYFNGEQIAKNLENFHECKTALRCDQMDKKLEPTREAIFRAREKYLGKQVY